MGPMAEGNPARPSRSGEPLVVPGILQKSGTLVIMRCANAALNVLVLIVLARWLGAGGVGSYAYLVIVLTLLSIPFANGGQTLVLKLTAEATALGDWSEAKGAMIAATGLAFVYAALVGLLFVVFFAIWPGILSEFGPGIVPTIAGILLLDSLCAIRSGFLRGLDRPAQAQLPELLIRPTILLVGLSVLLMVVPDGGYGVTTVFVLLLISVFVAFVAGFWLAGRAAPGGLRAAKRHYRIRWVSSAASFAAKGGAAILNSYVDILLLGVLLVSSVDVGIYRIAAQIAVVSGIVYVSINAIATQAFAVQLAEGDRHAVRATAVHSARVAFVASLPLLLIMVVLGEELVSLIFGAEFIEAAWIAVVLLVGQSINAGFGSVASLLTVSDRGWAVTRWFGYAALFNASLCLALIPAFGMLGAAFASLVAGLSLNAALWTIAKRELGVDTGLFGNR